MATTRTWFGGDGNYRNAGDWTPAGAPEPGDTALISSGTITVRNQVISGVALELDGSTEATEPNLVLNNVVLDLSSSIYEPFAPFPYAEDYAKITVRNTVSSSAPISLFGSRGDAHLTIDIARNSTFINNADFSNAGFLDVTGTASSRFVNNGTITTAIDPITVAVPTSGSGTFALETVSARPSGYLTFAESVGPNITVSFVGDYVYGAPTLVLDQPLKFHGSIAYDPNVPNSPGPTGQTVYLPNTTVTAESYADNRLTLFDAGTVVGRLKIAGDFTAADFGFRTDARGGTDLLFTAPSQLAAFPPAAAAPPTMPVPSLQS